MPSNTVLPPRSKSAFNNVQEQPQNLQKIHNKLILLEALKPLEEELVKRGLLPGSETGTFSPLWFIAETERNIFLWRSGCSLIQQDEYEFWVDTEELIRKRQEQISRNDSDNPFHNPLWSLGSSAPNDSQAERAYLQGFTGIISKISELAGSVCTIVKQIELCLEPDKTRPAVILPFKLSNKNLCSSSKDPGFHRKASTRTEKLREWIHESRK